MTVQTKAPAHQYFVALRITGDDLDPSRLTALLRVEPAQTWLKGEDARPRSQTSGWEFRLEPEHGRFWNSLEDGMTAVLDRLEPQSAAIREVAAQHQAIWWIGHFQTSLAGGPIFSARLLARLGTFGLALAIDNYFSPGDENNVD